MQAFTDLVGTATLPTHAFDIDELTELTPALDTAAHSNTVSLIHDELLSFPPATICAPFRPICC